MNKKGEEKVISVYGLAIMFIIAAAVVWMVLSFYGKPYDIRSAEARLLSDKVADCISSSGYLSDNWKSITNNNFLSRCEFNFNVENYGNWDNDQYYAGVWIYDFNSGHLLENFSAGNINLKADCEIQGKNYPVCLKREMYAIDTVNDQYRIEIFSIVGKVEKNV